jgi:hypothetical protein
MLVVRHPDTRPAERAYVLDVVLGDFLGLQWRAEPRDPGPLEITWSEDDDGRRLIVVDALLATPAAAWLTPRSMPATPLARWRPEDIGLAPALVSPEVPVIYGAELQRGGYGRARADRIELGIDLFGGILFQLARYEEIAQPASDEHDRYPPEASLAHREGFLTRPLVEEYVEILRSALTRLWPTLPLVRPEFRLRVSHDVDWPVQRRVSLPRGVKAIAGDLVRRRDVDLAARRLRSQLRRDPTDDPYYTFDEIMDASERRGLRSAFYFMAGSSDTRFDGTYRLDEPWVASLIARIHERGHEIGLHPSYLTYRDPARLTAERETLARCCEALGVEQARWGGRQHFLRWSNPVTWRAWDDAGLAYDASLGYARAPGFRCGVCREYPVFDLPAGRRLNLRESPLVAMDVFAVERPPAERPAALDRFAELKETCRRYGGEFTLLWHNSHLAARSERELYEAALQ